MTILWQCEMRNKKKREFTWSNILDCMNETFN